MSTLILSKSSLKKVFDEKIFSENVTINPSVRPKTALPGRRIQPADKPTKPEESPTIDNSTTRRSFSERPKTSVAKRKEHMGTHENFEKSSFNKISSHKSLEDIDIVEYFNDKAIRDIFPLNESGPEKRMYSKNGVVHIKRNNALLEAERLHRRKFNENNFLRDRRPTIKIEHDLLFPTNEMNECASEELYGIERKSKSFKEKPGKERQSRQRLHSDTDIGQLTKDSSNYDVYRFNKSAQNRNAIPIQSNRDIKTNYKVPFFSSKTDGPFRLYSPGHHLLDNKKKQPKEETYYKTNLLPNKNKLPRKLKPIVRVTDE